MGKFNLEEFAKEANKIWGGRYEYVDFRRTKNGKLEVGIVCHEKDKYGREHGIFWKVPYKHKEGQGCRSTAYCSDGNAESCRNAD